MTRRSNETELPTERLDLRVGTGYGTCFSATQHAWSVSNNVIYVKDCSAILNDSDSSTQRGVSLATALSLQWEGSARVANLSTLEPLLRVPATRMNSRSFALDWEGNGNAQTVKNSGKLKLVLEKGRYGDLKSAQANIDASYSPEGLDVPIIFLATNNMDFQAIAQAKGETLEISKIQLDQGKAKFAAGYAAIPFVWGNLGTSAPVVPSNRKVTATFQSENLDIRKVFEDIGVNQCIRDFECKLDAKGRSQT